MGYADDFLYRIDGTEHIADVGDGEEFCPFVDEGLDGFEAYSTLVSDRKNTNLNALPLLEQLPRNDVAVVLHLGDEDFVAFLHTGLAETGGYEIDALRSASGEDDFTRRTGIEKAAHRLASLFVEVGSLLGKEMNTTVDVGIHIIVFFRHRLNHLARFLRRGCIIEVDQGVLVVYLTRQDGEVFSQFTVHNSQFIIHNAQCPIHNAQLTIHNYGFAVHYLQSLHPSHFDNSPLKRLSTR